MSYSFDRDAHVHRLGTRIIPGSTDILKDAGFRYPTGNMDLGRAVHLATQYYDEEVLDPSSVSDEVFGYFEGWKKFCREHQTQWRRIETSDVNMVLAFAATLDREGTWMNPRTNTRRPVLAEIKKYSPTYFTGLQLALQDLTLPTLTLPRDRIVVELKANGEYKVHWFEDPNDKLLAMGIASLYWYKRNHGD